MKQELRSPLTEQDIDYIRSTGRDPDAVVSQFAVLQAGQKWASIARPAGIDDGILQLARYDIPALSRAYDDAAATGRISSFIPASGSATRLFQSLLHVYTNEEKDLDAIRKRASHGDREAKDAVTILENITDFAFWPMLEKHGCTASSVDCILATLFGERGFGFQNLPKALVPFHHYEDGPRTPFGEHIADAVALTTDSKNVCRLHFTVSPLHMAQFEEERSRWQLQCERDFNIQLQITFSVQSPKTDTIAIDDQEMILRNDLGQIAFRPGGHGALIENLSNSGGDIVFIRNIDNVAHRHRSVKILPIRKHICGLLLLFERQIHEAIGNLRRGMPLRQALDQLAPEVRSLHAPLLAQDADKEAVITSLNRPLRVCAVIPVSHHAGGGPLWAHGSGDRPSLQIVESSEVDMTNARNRELFSQSRYFNPVDMVCSIRDVDGKPFNLELFRAPHHVILTNKVVAGKSVRIYEHPGLWNGGMAFWNTIFVEAPDFTFNPVKSLSELLTPGHRSA